VDKEEQRHHDDNPVRAIDFDFASLRWPGWLLLFGSLGATVGVLALAKTLLAPVADKLSENQWGKALIGLGVFALVVGIFWAGQTLLGLLGLQVWRETPSKPPEPEE
jgi:hypothetical protein